MSLYVDLSEFLINPIRSGIQRIAGEMCRHLPLDSVIPVRLWGEGYIALPPELIRVIGSYFADHGDSGAAEIRRLGAPENGSTVEFSHQDSVLVPEVFDNPERLAYFRKLPDNELQRYRFIVYDLLPITHPEYFLPQTILPIYGYFQLLRRAQSCGFISEATRDAYYRRLKRTASRGGVILPLGCDSLGPKTDRPALNRPLTFSVLGTIEPRKNHELIFEALEPLLGQIKGLNLVFIGRIGWVDPQFAENMQLLAADSNSGFRLLSAPSDGVIRNYIEQSRATIYVSSAEGYGLPPVESLWAGTPVIASTGIPSLKDLGSAGIHYVDPLDVASLRQAVLTFLDDVYANRKAEEAVSLNLPTWQSFTERVLHWCGEEEVAY
jgi:glycosyltransferase involved in cell wall biosynthesis